MVFERIPNSLISPVFSHGGLNMKNTLAELILSRRKSLGLTQKQLAAKIGRSVALVGQIERGQTNPSLETLRRLKSVLRFDLEEVCSSPTPMSAAAFEISCLMESWDEEQQTFLLEIARLINTQYEQHQAAEKKV